MRGIKNDVLRLEALRLRIEERKSLPEIHVLTGASKGSLSVWLAGNPLTEEERKTRRLARPYKASPKKRPLDQESFLHAMTGGQIPLSRQDKGTVAEVAVLLRLILHGMRAFKAVGDCDRIDWIVESRARQLLKVQVKCTHRSRQGSPNVPLTRNATRGSTIRARYEPGDFDFIVGYDLYTDTAYVWSWAEVEHLKTSISVTMDAQERWDKFDTKGL